MASTLKRSQRERLIDAMVTLSTQRGYHKVSIAELCSQAGVSTETFYAQFETKEECFLGAYVACRKRMFAPVWALAAQSGDCSQAARLALEELLKDLARDPTPRGFCSSRRLEGARSSGRSASEHSHSSSAASSNFCGPRPGLARAWTSPRLL